MSVKLEVPVRPSAARWWAVTGLDLVFVRRKYGPSSCVNARTRMMLQAASRLVAGGGHPNSPCTAMEGHGNPLDALFVDRDVAGGNFIG